MALLVDRDEQILLADPGYPCNRHFVRVLEGGRRSAFRSGPNPLSADRRARGAHWTPQTRGVLIASPSNPTGTTVPHDEMRGSRQRSTRTAGS